MKNKPQVGRFLQLLLKENEQRFSLRGKGRPRPRTDEELLQQLINMFPSHKGIKAMVAGRNTVNNYRKKLNCGSYYRGEEPLWPPSFRYNKYGHRVSGKTGVKRLTRKEQEKIINQHARLRRTFMEANDCYYDADETIATTIL